MPKLKHPSRDAVFMRLKRAEGHLRSTLAAISADRSSLELARQLQAVEAAVGAAKQQLIHEQVQACLGQGEADNSTLRQLKYLAQYL